MDFNTASGYLAAIAEEHSRKINTDEPILVSLCGDDPEQIEKLVRKIQTILAKKYDPRTLVVLGITIDNITTYNNLRTHDPDIKIPMLILTAFHTDISEADEKSAAAFDRLPEIVVSMQRTGAGPNAFQTAENILEMRSTVTTKVIPAEHPKEIPFSVPEIIIIKPEPKKIPAASPQGK